MMATNPNITARVFASSMAHAPWHCIGAFSKGGPNIRLVHFSQGIDSPCQPATDLI